LSEIANLRWHQVDLDKRLIRDRRQAHEDGHSAHDTAGTDGVRIVGITANAVTAAAPGLSLRDRDRTLWGHNKRRQSGLGIRSSDHLTNHEVISGDRGSAVEPLSQHNHLMATQPDFAQFTVVNPGHVLQLDRYCRQPDDPLQLSARREFPLVLSELLPFSIEFAIP
jgi:hypothetical protein